MKIQGNNNWKNIFSLCMTELIKIANYDFEHDIMPNSKENLKKKFLYYLMFVPESCGNDEELYKKIITPFVRTNDNVAKKRSYAYFKTYLILEKNTVFMVNNESYYEVACRKILEFCSSKNSYHDFSQFKYFFPCVCKVCKKEFRNFDRSSQGSYLRSVCSCQCKNIYLYEKIVEKNIKSSIFNVISRDIVGEIKKYL